MDKEKRRRIDQINEWVRRYKEEGDEEARLALLKQFHPLILKCSAQYNAMYPGTFSFDQIVHEAQIIFCDLLDEYIIGGDAYFNVLIERKLPLRLKWHFVKEIRQRQRYVVHDDEFLVRNAGTDDNAEQVVDALYRQSLVDQVMDVINDGETLTEREREIIIENLVHGKSHVQIAQELGISRSRVSRLVKSAITKVKRKLGVE